MSKPYRLPDGSVFAPLLHNDALRDKLNCYHAETVTLTRTEAWTLREIVACYEHLIAHPAGTEAAVRKLRMARRAVNDWTAKEPV